jgi:hypothetical protein
MPHFRSKLAVMQRARAQCDGLVLKIPFFSMRGTTDDQELIETILQEMQMPGPWYLMILDSRTSGVRKKFKQLEGAESYQRSV